MTAAKGLLFSFVALIVFGSRAASQDPVPLYPDNYNVLLENDNVRVMEFTLKKGGTEQFHQHPAAVTYVLDPFKIRFTFPDGTTKIRETKAGDVLYGDAVAHSPLNIGETNARGLIVEMKQQPSKKSDKPPHGEYLTAVTFIKGIEGKEDDLKRHLLSLEAPTLAEPGCVMYDLYQSTTKKNEFVRLEAWNDEAALEAHKQTPHLKASFEKRKKEGWTTEITLWKRVREE